MARTKQTARKSTGGVAPRTHLAGSLQPHYHRLTLSRLLSAQYSASEAPLVSDIASTSNAQEQVLSTPELLVIILSQLPHSSLLRAKSVNKTWANLFGNVEIRAALFEVPRPKESALYTETYSDLLADKLWTCWPVHSKEELEEVESEESSDEVETLFERRDWTSINEELLLKGGSKHQRKEIKTVELQLENYTDHSLPWQWRHLLLSQPAVEYLELVQQIDRRGGSTLEFRATIHRPGGVRMGFLYDAVRYWHEIERSSVELLWGRKTGDVTKKSIYYIEGSSFEKNEGRYCVTILGKTSVGCGQYGGLTYESSGHGTWNPLKPEFRFIKSGDEDVEFSMLGPKSISYDMSIIFASRAEEEEIGDV